MNKISYCLLTYHSFLFYISKLLFVTVILYFCIHFHLAPVEGLFFKPKYRANILCICFNFIAVLFLFLSSPWGSVYGFLKSTQNKAAKNICIKGKVIIRINFNPGLALTGFRTILPGFQQVNELAIQSKTSTWSMVNFKKHVTLMSCILEPAIWSCDTSQQIPCFNRCQLIITWMPNIKEVNSKPRLHVSVNLLLEYGRHLA